MVSGVVNPPQVDSIILNNQMIRLLKGYVDTVGQFVIVRGNLNLEHFK
jgi:hypothetical protein